MKQVLYLALPFGAERLTTRVTTESPPALESENEDRASSDIDQEECHSTVSHSADDSAQIVDDSEQIPRAAPTPPVPRSPQPFPLDEKTTLDDEGCLSPPHPRSSTPELGDDVSTNPSNAQRSLKLVFFRVLCALEDLQRGSSGFKTSNLSCVCSSSSRPLLEAHINRR